MLSLYSCRRATEGTSRDSAPRASPEGKREERRRKREEKTRWKKEDRFAGKREE